MLISNDHAFKFIIIIFIEINQTLTVSFFFFEYFYCLISIIIYFIFVASFLTIYYLLYSTTYLITKKLKIIYDFLILDSLLSKSIHFD